MKKLRKIVFVLLVLFIAIQFFQPARNANGQDLPTNITKLYTVPNNVQELLTNSCYDCHSDNTNYPWYSHIQPGAWLMASHIKEGKSVLNFSHFGNLSIRKQRSKLQGMINQIKDDAMPISSYTFIHQNAKLSISDKKVLIRWMQATKDSLSHQN